MDLFDDLPPPTEGALTQLVPGAVLLHGFAREIDADLLQAIESVIAQAPLRHLQTPGGFTMSVAMSNCGPLGWVSSASGYRYAACDPLSGQPWPAMPTCLMDLAQRAAAQAGYVVHGDVVVWGGPSRLAYHGVTALADGGHAQLGRRRVNLTFRCVG